MRRGLISLWMLVLIAGCSGKPGRLTLEGVEPNAFAERVMEQCDENQDGTISSEELEKFPGLAAATGNIDKNRDGQLTREEVQGRAQAWLDRKAALTQLPVKVNWQGRDISGAVVRFVPETFMGETYGPAEGTTNEYGIATLRHAPEHRPDPEFSEGVRIGIYRVEITWEQNGKQVLPEKFNTQTELGQEVAADGAGMAGGVLTFALRGR